jgi:acyl-CoA synthetase (AMP-forming)/AMP-acid ligase II
MNTLADVLLASAAAHADRAALWVDDRPVSYRELTHSAFGVANALNAVSNRRTAVYANRHSWAYAGIAGALLAGHAYVPLNPHHPRDRLRSILHQADVGALVLDQQALEACRPLILTHPPMTVIVPDGSPPHWWGICRDHRFVGATDLRHDPTEPALAPQDGAYLLFTSGSTGEPKGVMVSHENIMA